MKSVQVNEIYRYSHYREFLNHCFPAKGEGRGGRAKLAKLLGCQPGFVSIVLAEKSDFTPEHGMQIAEYLHLNMEEKNYFLLLLQKDRAGSVALRQHYETQIKAIQNQKKEVKSRIAVTHEISFEDQMRYYQSWFQTAVHMCTLVPRLRTPAAMSEYLYVPIETIKQTLETLLQLGVVTQKNGQFSSTQKRMHISEKNIALKTHHANWRHRALNALDFNNEEALHYSSVMSISKSAMTEIKQILLKAIESSEPVIKEAKDEGVFALTMDLFEVNR